MEKSWRDEVPRAILILRCLIALATRHDYAD